MSFSLSICRYQFGNAILDYLKGEIAGKQCGLALKLRKDLKKGVLKVTNLEFIQQFQDLATDLFYDRYEKKPEAKAKIWCDAIIKDVKAGKYTNESALRGMEKLIRSEVAYPTLGSLMRMIEEERSLSL